MAGPRSLNILFIDFYDSFSYNIVQLVSELGHRVSILSYEEVLIQKEALSLHELIILGPGPGHLSDYSEFIQFLEDSFNEHYFLGICLGHQMLGSINGHNLKKLETPVHGQSLRVAESYHFLGIDSSRAMAMFYNSWSLERGLSAKGQCIVEHRMITLIDLPNALGLQFHPESVGTSCPKRVLDSALSLVYNKKNEDSTTNHWSLRSEDYSTSQRKQSL